MSRLSIAASAEKRGIPDTWAFNLTFARHIAKCG